MNAPRTALLVLALGTALPLAAQQPAAPSAADLARQPVVIERAVVRVRYERDGTGRTDLEFRGRVQTEAGVQSLGQLAFPYDSASERLDIEVVRVIKAAGDTVTAGAGAVQDVTGPVAREAPTFSDLREKVVTVPALRPGDVLEYALHWTVHAPLAPGQFWRAEVFSRDAIVLDQQLILDVPRDKYVQVRTLGIDQPLTGDAGDRRTYRWHFANLRVDSGEAHAPRRAAADRPSVLLSTFRSWDEVGRWYGGLERERETPTAAIRAVADSLVRGRTSFADSVAALYDFVGRETRYVSLSFGVGRYQPHAAADVLANRYGDCKDKHTLLAALLRSVGIASAPVLVSTDAPIDSTVPSPGQFDHVITLVPGRADTLWLDATPGVAPFRFLWSELRGRQSLVTPPDGPARLLRAPEAPPFPEFERLSVEGRLSEPARLTATVRRALRSDAEVATRAVFRAIPEDRLNLVAQRLAADDGLQGTISGARESDPVLTREPFELSYQADQPDAVTWDGLRARFRLPLPSLVAEERDSAAQADSAQLFLGEQARRLRLEVPDAWRVELPVAVNSSTDFGRYHSTYEIRGSALVVERVLTFTRRWLPPSRGRDLAALERTIREDEEQLVRFTRTSVPAPGRTVAGDVDGLLRAGRAAYDRRDYRGAIRALRQVVAANPQHLEAWNDLGRAFLGTSQLDSAAAAFRRAIALDPNSRYAYNNLGLALWRTHHDAEAAAAFRDQIRVNPLDQYAHSNLGQLALETHQDSVAVAELRLAAGITPERSSAHLTLGRAYVQAGQPDAAVAAFERALAINRGPDVLNSVAYALAERGVRLDRAEALAREAVDSAEAPLRNLALDEVGPMEAFAALNLAHVWDTVGWVLFQKGDFAGAEAYLRAAWLLTPRSGAIGDHLGRTYERLGRPREAMRAYAAALATGDSLPAARSRLNALAGSAVRARQLLNEASHGGSQAARTVTVARATRLNGSGMVQLLFGPGPTIVDLRFESGPDDLQTLADAIRASAAAFPVAFPDSSPIRLPRSGVLGCSPASGCTVILTETPTTASVIQTFPVRPPD